MREKENVSPQLPSGIKVKWDGIFDAEAVYKKIKYWLDFNGFGSNFEEEEYSELSKGDSKVLGARWHAEKVVTGYFGYVIEINMFITGMRDVQAQRNGINITLNKGKFEIRLAAHVVKDIDEKYKSKLMQTFYEKVISKERVDEHKRLLAIKLYELQDEIKRFLAMP